MLTVDVLGSRMEDSDVLNQVMVAEANDPELNAIVKKAASELGTPIALVTLVLNHVQLFQAHVGLPDELAAARATERDVSFCQFVVRDGEPFEVVDASSDDRIPQALVNRYGIMAYLGIPLRVQDVVVGSLCVIDTKARGFDSRDRAQLVELAQTVNVRLEKLAEQRRKARRSLSPRVLAPGVTELSASLHRTTALCSEAEIAAATVDSCHRMLAYTQAGGTVAPGAAEGSLRVAILAMESLNSALVEIECSGGEAMDCVNAIESLVSTGARARLSEILYAAQDLARGPCRPVGGAPIPFLSSDPVLASTKAQSVPVLASMLVHLAERMAELNMTGGLEMRLEETDSLVVVSVAASGLGISDYSAVNAALGEQNDPTLRVVATDASLSVSLAVARASGT